MSFKIFFNLVLFIQLNYLSSLKPLFEEKEKDKNLRNAINNIKNEIIDNEIDSLSKKIKISAHQSKTDFLKDKIMAHRGLFGYYPEHVQKGFELAYFMGADFMETDIGLTKDGKIIVMHDPVLDHSTNVEDFPEFKDRRTTKKIGSKTYKNNFFITDFTYEEILKLNTKQRHSNRPQIYNHDFKILLIEDIIKMVIDFNQKYNKTTGIYIEPKNNVIFHQELNMDINEELLKVLVKYNLTNFYDQNFMKCPVVIQSFHKETLQFFREKADLPHIYLINWAGSYNFTESTSYADGLGPNISYLLYERVDDLLFTNGTNYDNYEEFKKNVIEKSFDDSIEVLGKKIKAKKNNVFIDYVHSLGMVIAPYDINNDTPKFDYNPIYEFCKMKRLGTDSFFADFCDTALFATKNANKLCE